MSYRDDIIEIKAKCIQNHKAAFGSNNIEFTRGKVYRMEKSDGVGVRVYLDDNRYYTFAYCDYTFFFKDIATHRDNIIDDLLAQLP